ncbi:MAG: prepilin-type N-terminal cleavage/methylation domain-containing protein [Bryobacteraceae bacterium]
MRRADGQRAGEAGVTLMEVLIAMALLSLLSAGMLLAMRVGLNAMEKSNSKLMDNRRVLGVERVLEQQIAGYMPVRGECRAEPKAPATPIGFFQGEPQTMRFVSTYSLQEAGRGRPRILEYQVIPGEEGRGVRLVVNELLYSGPFSTAALCIGFRPDPLSGAMLPAFRPVEAGPNSFVLADKLAHCRFSYKEAREAPEPEVWRPAWILQRPPAGIRIDLAPLEPDPSKLQLTAITMPMRVQCDPLEDYTKEEK